MKKLNHLNQGNNKNQKEMNFLTQNENGGESGFNKNIFPTLNYLQNSQFNNYNNKALHKRSSTEDFKRSKIFSENENKFSDENINKNYFEENDNNVHNKKNKFKSKKSKNKMKLSKNKKYNNKNQTNRDYFNYLRNDIKDNLLNTITVRQAKELKKAKINFRSKPKAITKKFENIKIVRLNNEINIEPKLKEFKNLDFFHQFETIGLLTGKRFKDLEIIKEKEENLNLNAKKKFEVIDIYEAEKDFQIIDVKNFNYIKSDTLSENFSGENIGKKIEVKHVKDMKFSAINIKKKFSELEIVSEIKNSPIETIFKKRESIVNMEESKDDNNINNNFENDQLLNNINHNKSGNIINLSNNGNMNQLIDNNSEKEDNIKTSQNNDLLNNQEGENNTNSNKNNENEIEVSKKNINEQLKTSTVEEDEFYSNEPNQFNNIYLKDIKTNIIDTKSKKKDYSQINNEYDSDSKLNNTSNLEKILDKSNITPIKMDMQNYSKLIEGNQKEGFNIYSSEKEKLNNNINNIENHIYNNENNNDEDNKSKDYDKYKDKNCITFKEDKSNSSNNKIMLSNNNKEESKINIKSNKNIQKKNKKRNSENIQNKIKKDLSRNKKNSNKQINIKSDKNINNQDKFSGMNKINKTKDKISSNQTLSENIGKITKNLSNVPNLFSQKDNNLNKIHNSTNSLNNKKLKSSTDKVNNNQNKNNEESFSSSLYIRSKNSLFNGSRKSTQKQ